MASEIFDFANTKVAESANNANVQGVQIQIQLLRIVDGQNLVEGHGYRLVDANHPRPGLAVVLMNRAGAGMAITIFRSNA